MGHEVFLLGVSGLGLWYVSCNRRKSQTPRKLPVQAQPTNRTSSNNKHKNCDSNGTPAICKPELGVIINTTTILSLFVFKRSLPRLIVSMARDLVPNSCRRSTAKACIQALMPRPRFRDQFRASETCPQIMKSFWAVGCRTP